MGYIIYVVWCFGATFGALALLSHYVIGPWAQWSQEQFGFWDLPVYVIAWAIAYPFAMRAERRAAIENGLKPPRHLWSRRERLEKPSERNP